MTYCPPACPHRQKVNGLCQNHVFPAVKHFLEYDFEEKRYVRREGCPVKEETK